MYVSKSFCNVASLISNTPGVNSPVGELSAQAVTFSREVGIYEDAARPGYTLFNFKSTNDTGMVPVQQNVALQAMTLIKYVVDKTMNTPGQIYQDELLNELIAWGSTNSAQVLNVGPVRNYGNYWLPDWIRWSSDHVSETNENIVWLAISSFVNEYDEFEIVVVPPLDNLNQFFSGGVNVENLINSMTLPMTMDRIQSYRENKPETILRSDDYDYIDPANSSHRVRVNWPVLIYGPAGNNIDSIKDALVDYILANSTHSRSEWTALFPDLFKRTEFVIAPHWDKIAIQTMAIQPGIYSPLSGPKERVEFLKSVVSSYAAAHVETNAISGAHPYQCIAFTCVGSAENRDALYQLQQVFPDYLSVSSTHPDFERMSPTTQAWVLHLNQLLITAESMHEHSQMPSGYTKLTRGGILYAVKSYNNIQYLVASKKSIYAMLGLTMP